MSIRSRLIATGAAMASMFAGVSAHAVAAAPPNELPEPGTWALVGLAAVVGIVVSRRRKK
jgi:H+/Cl- antiporter ClcA